MKNGIDTLMRILAKPNNKMFARHVLVIEWIPWPVLELLAKDCNFKAVSAVSACNNYIREAFYNNNIRDAFYNTYHRDTLYFTPCRDAFYNTSSRDALYNNYDTTVWSGYRYQIICLICLHGIKCSTFTWPWVFRVRSCVWLCRGFLGLNPASGCVVDFQSRILITVPNIILHSALSGVVSWAWYQI